MPELPEVQTVLDTIWPELAGRTVVRANVLHPDVVAGMSAADFAELFAGARFVAAARRGKYMLFDLQTAGGPPTCTFRVLVHLRMTGKMRCVARGEEAPLHTHLRLELDDGRDLLFTDTRRFGRWTVLGAEGAEAACGPKGFQALGPEPVGDTLKLKDFAAALAKRKGRLKGVLLDQTFIAGIGNIYADEILFRARLHPMCAANSLSRAEARRLYDAMRTVLKEAIGLGGTTIRDYVDGLGRKGSFVYSLAVYGRTGEPCPECGTAVERIIVAGRSTHYCPLCQRVKPRAGRMR